MSERQNAHTCSQLPFGLSKSWQSLELKQVVLTAFGTSAPLLELYFFSWARDPLQRETCNNQNDTCFNLAIHFLKELPYALRDWFCLDARQECMLWSLGAGISRESGAGFFCLAWSLVGAVVCKGQDKNNQKVMCVCFPLGVLD